MSQGSLRGVEELLVAVAVLLAALIGAILVVAANLPKPSSVSDWLTIVLALAAVGQIVIAGLSLQSLRHAQVAADAALKSLAASRENAQRQLRAYVAVKSFESLDFEAGKPLRVRVNYANTGQTPAHELSVDTLVGVYDADAAVAFPTQAAHPPERGSVAHLGAQSEIAQTSRMDRALTVDEMEAMKAGRLKIVCCGRISYRDVFDEAQHTDFHATLCATNAHGLTEFRRSPVGNHGT
ncbi:MULTISPECIES: hypothetical protein [unclassified Phenylobacterium]|uniref:hypothetical protein n=1 Tax=unclassified Phenylobacterium TaxID=2640670 RepID=UPI00083B30FE|nr:MULTISPECIES: hypothetical protein [unclassified Phenylobacterium]